MIMKNGRLVRGVAIFLAVLGMCVPELAFAAPTPAAPAVVDVALTDGGVLHGQLIDLRGGNAAGVPVSVKAQNKEISAPSPSRTAALPFRACEAASTKSRRAGPRRLSPVDGQGCSAVGAEERHRLHPGHSSAVLRKCCWPTRLSSPASWLRPLPFPWQWSTPVHPAPDRGTRKRTDRFGPLICKSRWGGS